MIQATLFDCSSVETPDPAQTLAGDELTHFAALRSEPARRQFLLGRLLLKAVLTQRDHRRAGEFKTIRTKIPLTGKPEIADAEFSGVEFNISHDEDSILVAVGDQPVGVDIERIQYFDGSMMNLCFDQDERRRILRASRPDRVATLLWCIKEAAAKATGEGIVSVMGKTARSNLFARGGFVRVAGADRAYAICSPLPLSPVRILPERQVMCR